MKIYSAGRSDRSAAVKVMDEATGAAYELDPRPSLAIENHSPTGFEWGYGGSGPAQLALAILLDYTGDQEFAAHQHQDFKWKIVANLDRMAFELRGETIDKFIMDAYQEWEKHGLFAQNNYLQKMMKNR